MKLIVGLGNGVLFGRGSRHNLGARLVEDLAATVDASWHLHWGVWSSSLNAWVAQCPNLECGGGAVLLWPLSSYNNVGGVVAAAACKFNVAPSDIILVHDDVDVGVGAIKRKFGGSHGGNNGVRSVIAALGTDRFERVRVGVGRPSRSEGQLAMIMHVLGSPTAQDSEEILAAWAQGSCLFTHTDDCHRFRPLDLPFASVPK